MTILEKIIAYKEKEIENLEDLVREKLKKYSLKKSQKNFLEFLQKPGLSLIAEIKKASPSKGNIFPDAPVEKIAKIYEKSGVSAISVLTDEHFFSGSVQDLEAVTKSVNIPVLRKDFYLNKHQITEARLHGADAILLMVSVLKSSEKIKKLREYAESLGMYALVETHDESEIKIAIESGAKIIGVNSRDFTDLSINTKNFQKLLPLIPDHIVKVAESGLLKRADVQKVEKLADAILVGSSIMEQGIEGIEKQIYELKGKYFKDFENWNKLKQQVEKKERRKKRFHVGEIWFMYCGVNIGHEICGKGSSFLRPVLIIKKVNNDLFIGIPFTTKNIRNYPLDIKLPGGSFALFPQISKFSEKRLFYKKAKISRKKIKIIQNELYKFLKK